MNILNSELDFVTAPNDVRRAFLGQRAERRLIPMGHELYKFTQHQLFKTDGTVTPWWSSVLPLDANDPGLAGTLERAANLGAAASEFARTRTAVTRQWNRMTDLQRARLLVSVYGFVGRCSGQKMDDDPQLQNVIYIGGAYQIWIPNLTRGMILQSAIDR